MICFDVELNGRRLCVAGAEGNGVLTTSVGWYVGSNPAPGLAESGYSFVMVSGLIKDQHMRWADVHNELQIGDAVTIRVVSGDAADVPTETTAANDPVE